MQQKSFTLAELADLLHADLIGHPEHRIFGANAIDKAAPGDASFLANPRYSAALKESAAGVICIDRNTAPIDGKNFLVSDDPSRTFQKIAELFLSGQCKSAFIGIHPTAVIAPSATLGKDVTIGPYADISSGQPSGQFNRLISRLLESTENLLRIPHQDGLP